MTASKKCKTAQNPTGANVHRVYGSESEIDLLVDQFRTCTLPHSEWTHQAHLTVALWYLHHCSADQATVSIRTGIRRYNQANGVEMTPTSGYHETMTLFWMCAVSFYLSVAGPGRSIVALANGLPTMLGNKRLPLEYYSSDRLMSWRARSSWLEPDLKALF
jgi:hypothetical protein